MDGHRQSTGGGLPFSGDNHNGSYVLSFASGRRRVAGPYLPQEHKMRAPATLPWETIDLIQSLLAAVQMGDTDKALALAGKIEPTIDALYAERFF